MQSLLDIMCKVNYTKNAKITMHGGVMRSKIAELRKQNKLSQEELAMAVGVTRQTITSLEVGKYTASLVLAYKIAKHFDLSIEEVFDFTDLKEEE